MASISASALISHGMATNTVTATPAGKDPKMWAAAQDFEAMFLDNMFSQMMTGLGKDGPFGGGKGIETWRGMMVQEWSKTVAAKGGVGLADQVYKDMIAIQERSS